MVSDAYRGAPFPWPGGKSRHADWIRAHLPPHECFVDVFGGSGAVLANREPSGQEVYNDWNADLVTFFEVLSDRPGALKKRLQHIATVFGRCKYEEFAGAWHGHQRPDGWVEVDDPWQGYRPRDDLERAAVFFALRYMQVSGRADCQAGFSTGKQGNHNSARTFANAVEDLDGLAERFRPVTIECDDYRGIFDRYDGPETLFYLDPPYVGREAYYGIEFDHEEFADRLAGLDGAWAVSYDEVPSPVREQGTVIEREVTHQMSHSGTTATERLVVSYPVSEEGQVRLKSHI